MESANDQAIYTLQVTLKGQLQPMITNGGFLAADSRSQCAAPNFYQSAGCY